MPISFDLYPDSGWVYVRVYIWRTQQAMWRKVGMRPYDYSAINLGGFHVNKKTNALTGLLSEVHICRKALGAGVVSNELLHSTMSYFRTRRDIGLKLRCRNPGKGMVSGEEEAKCWVLGNLNRQFWTQFYKSKPECVRPYLNPIPKIFSKKPYTLLRKRLRRRPSVET